MFQLLITNAVVRSFTRGPLHINATQIPLLHVWQIYHPHLLIYCREASSLNKNPSPYLYCRSAMTFEAHFISISPSSPFKIKAVSLISFLFQKNHLRIYAHSIFLPASIFQLSPSSVSNHNFRVWKSVSSYNRHFSSMSRWYPHFISNYVLFSLCAYTYITKCSTMCLKKLSQCFCYHSSGLSSLEEPLKIHILTNFSNTICNSQLWNKELLLARSASTSTSPVTQLL